MNKKISNYIGLGVGILLTLTILYANDNYRSHSGDDKDSRYDFITYDINQTMVYDVFCSRYCSDPYRRYVHVGSYLFWYILLIIGFWLSWKYKTKLGNNISKIAKKIHDKT